MIQVIDYHPDHLERIVLKEIHDGEKPKKISTQALTLIQDGEPIAIFGMIFLGAHVVHLWGLVSEGVRKTPLSFFKTCESLLHWMEEKYQIHRFQMDILPDYLEGQRFARALGFEKEGTLRKFGSDRQDRLIYGRA